MARRRSRRSFASRASRGVSKNALIDGAMGGAAAALAAGYVGPTYGPAAGLAAVGIWRKNPTLQTMAGASIGAQLAGGLKLPGSSGGLGSGGVL